VAQQKKQTQKSATIDAIYQKYARSVVRTLASTDFYEFFMDTISRAENSIEFSNLRQEKIIDPIWVDKINASLQAFQNIASNPRNIIKEEDIVVNVAHAKRSGPDVVRHLAQHGQYVNEYDERTHDVKPNHLMQKVRDDSADLYENRFVFTVLESVHHFVRIRYDALFEVIGDEYGAKIKLTSDLDSASEEIHFDSFMHIKQKQSILEADEENGDILGLVAKLYRVLTMFMNTPFAQKMSRLPRVKGTITKTNVLKKNPDYKVIVALWEFLKSYDDVGYAINVTEQNPQITEQLQADLFNNIMYQYIVLKNHMDAESERRVGTPTKQKKKTLKPKFIREIVEELTEDYDLPDVEIRKVLIEQLTKEQLMKEEEAERRRLVEEKQRLEKEKKEQERLEKEAEKERLRLEKEAEKERIAREKEAQRERERVEALRQQNLDRRYATVIGKELDKFNRALEDLLEQRHNDLKKQKPAVLSDYSDAVEQLELKKERQLARQRREELRIKQEREQRERAQREQERLEAERLEKQIKEDNAAFTDVKALLSEFLQALSEQMAERDEYNRVQAELVQQFESRRNKKGRF